MQLCNENKCFTSRDIIGIGIGAGLSQVRKGMKCTTGEAPYITILETVNLPAQFCPVLKGRIAM